MAYCGPHSIPYTWFTGQSKANRWDDLSRAAAIAWQRREADRCGTCGQYRADWLDENGIELFDPPFEVYERFCPGCYSLELHEMDHEKDEKLARAGFRPAFKPTVEWVPPSDASDAETDGGDTVAIVTPAAPGEN